MTQARHDPPESLLPRGRAAWRSVRAALSSVGAYFTEQNPNFFAALTPALLVTALLFVRSPTSNYIFDEQEALLANPYVNAQGLKYWEAVKRDFWGLLPDRSIGSYRPIPNYIWRALWHISKQPFLHHWVNVIGHAVNAALVASFCFALTQRRRVSWLAGACFAASALLTEAVTGVVGIADVLGGLGVLLALHALRLPLWATPGAVFLGLSFGLFSKESAIVGVPLLTLAALISAWALKDRRPLGPVRALVVLLSAVAALVVYTEFRRRFFPVALPSDLAQGLPEGTPVGRRALHAFLRWFQQPQLPNDAINNPLVLADTPHRIAGALRVFASGIGQVVWPWNLSGDYSFPQEPVPARLVFVGSVVGGAFLLGLPLFAFGSWLVAIDRHRARQQAPAPSPEPSGQDSFGPPRGLELPPVTRKDGRTALVLALGALWLPIAYFPHSNIPVLLPTVRAERFWYLPMVGAALLLAVLLDRLLEIRWRALGIRLVLAFFAVQIVQARAHALDYADDLAFWDATRRAVPNSAKAHLNYSVMVGARGRLEDRLQANRRALDLAPNWPMAHVYYGDTLCRMQKPDAAFPYYKRGFELAPNDPNLIALGLQCLWDQKGVESRKAELLELAGHHTGSWLALLATELVYYGPEHNGIQPKYRPRSYNEGPRSE
ncbi:MAG TPA: tetratricopeptide repeat protein [Polyangiaceae bacterium]|nr:tetratricopeptide repeat protein [Polyangiaceae bacterium]